MSDRALVSVSLLDSCVSNSGDIPAGWRSQWINTTCPLLTFEHDVSSLVAFLVPVPCIEMAMETETRYRDIRVVAVTLARLFVLARASPVSW